MPKEDNVTGKYVKRDTMLIVVFIALAVGFLGGAAFGIYKSGSKMPVQTPMPPQQMTQDQEPTAEQTRVIQDLELRTTRNPKDIEAWTRLGNTYFDTKQYAKSIRAYKKSLNLNPDNPNVWTDLGIMYRRNGQPKKAIESFDRAIALDPRHEPSRLNKGIVLLHDLNDPKGAVKAWEGLVEVNPMAMAPGGIQSLREMLDRLKASMNQ